MHVRRITLSLIAGTSIAGGAVLGISSALAGAVTSPTVQIQPSTNLADGQLITATGTGFTPSAFIATVECQAGATSEANCDISNYQDTTASSDGSFSTPFIVSRYIQVGGATIDCAVPGACIFVAANFNNQTEAATIPLTFDPNAPTPPALTVGGTVSRTATVDSTTGFPMLSGTVTCNRPAFVSVYGQVGQIKQHALATGFFSANVLCTSSGTWNALVFPQTLSSFTHGILSASASVSGTAGSSFSQPVAFSGPVSLKSKS